MHTHQMFTKWKVYLSKQFEQGKYRYRLAPKIPFQVENIFNRKTNVFAINNECTVLQ
jgi:hypothetical protein